ncbi:MAG: hypothetical protein NTW60_03985, partial [Candidatus Wolfebacteria bacterium]|nr:hypothetical protein [Candidatus Wolfebacteria bacterium]
GKDQCDAFCNNPDNQQTCFNFAKENGMIPREDLQRMEEGQKQFQQSMQNIPSEVADCLKALLGNEMFEKMKNGQAMPPKESGEKMGQCFSKMTPPQGQAGGGSGFPPISDMSQEARDCVKSAIGDNAFGQIQSQSIKNEDKAKLFEQAKNCFENFGPKNQESSQGMAPGNQMVPKIEPNGSQGPGPGMMPDNQYASGTGPGMPQSPQRIERGEGLSPENMPPGDQYVPKIIAPQAPEQKMMIDNQFAPGTGPNVPQLPQQEIMPGNQLAPGTGPAGAPGTDQLQPIPQQPFIQQSPQPEPQATPPTSLIRSRDLFGSVFEVFISAFGL